MTAATRVLTALVVVVLLLGSAAAATAQTPPLQARLILKDPPPGAVYHPSDPATPITILLQLLNTSGAPVVTTEGFSTTEFWRRLYFVLPTGGTITDASTDHGHRHDSNVGFCQYRSGIDQRVSIPVVPVEMLPGPPQAFTLEFRIDDARTLFDLSRAGGAITVQARIPLLTVSGGDILNDCDQFAGTTVVNVGRGALERQEWLIVSNSLEFTIVSGDTEPPVTTIAGAPEPNGVGWNNQNVTLTLSAVDTGGSGVKQIVATASGAQTGAQTFPGASGAFVVSGEGTTSVAVRAEDNAGNVETPQFVTVRVDKTPPVVTPPGPISVVATSVNGTATAAQAPPLAGFLAGGTAADALDPAPVRLTPQRGGADVTADMEFPLGPTAVSFRFQDRADNVGSAAATVTVVPGTPRIEGALVGKGLDEGSRFYDVRLTNTGNGIARDVRINTLTLRTLSGTGTVTRNPRLALPIIAGDLAVGASTVVRLYLVVPSTVTRFSITESGTTKNVATPPTTYNFSLSQATTP